MPRPFSPAGRVATTQSLHQVLGNHIEAALLQAKAVYRVLGDGAERMPRLERADE
jgi:hypothetical protein